MSVLKFCINSLLNKRTHTLLNNLSKTLCTTYDLNLVVKGVSLNNYIRHLQKEYEESSNKNSSLLKSKIAELQPIINILNERRNVVDNIQHLSELLKEKDEDIQNLVKEEQLQLENEIKIIDEKLLQAILPIEKEDLRDSVILEVKTGVGGQEAMLFANELFDMYCRFTEYKGWKIQTIEHTTTDLGGIRHGSALINGYQVFRYFKHEAGVHRVQRIPATEKSGRIHTSTVSVTALPQPTEIEICIDNKDLKIETKKASGAGGQHVNTTDSAVRITHLPTGITVDSQVDRSQIKNKQMALAKLRALLYQKELESQVVKNEATKRSQVRSNFRNEKIRTYNFPQDRITDHRLQHYSVHNLKGFLQGSNALEDLINKLDNHFKLQTLLNFVSSLNKTTR